MKQHIHLRLFSLGLVALGLFLFNCGTSSENSKQEMVEKLIESFNKKLPGTTVKIDLENCTVEPAENNRYWITFRNSSITTDVVLILKSINKDSSPEQEDFSSLDTAHIDKIVVLYGPREKYLSVRSIEGITVNHKFSKFEGKQPIPNLGEFKVENVNISVDNFTCPDMNISGLIKNKKSDPGEVKNLDSPKKDTVPDDTIFENAKIEVNYTLNQRNNFSIIWETGKVSLKPGIDNPYLTPFFTSKSVPPPDYEKILQKGMKFMGLSIGSEKTKFSIKTKGFQWDIGSIEKVSFSSLLEPDKTGKSFKLGYQLSIKDFRLVIPLKPDVERLTNVKEVRFEFSMEHLSPKAIQGLMNLINTVTELRDLTDNSKLQETMFQNLQFLVEIFKSKPLFKFSFSPFKHYLGELSAVAIIRSFLPLHVEINVNIVNIDEILMELKGMESISPAFLKSILDTTAKLFVRKENGNASMVIEIKPDMPGILLLNGMPIKIPDSLLNPLVKSPMKHFGF